MRVLYLFPESSNIGQKPRHWLGAKCHWESRKKELVSYRMAIRIQSSVMGIDKNQCNKETGEWTWGTSWEACCINWTSTEGTAGRTESRGWQVSEGQPDTLEGTLFTGTTWMQMTSCSGTGICPALLRMMRTSRGRSLQVRASGPEKWQQADQIVNDHVCSAIRTSS